MISPVRHERHASARRSLGDTANLTLDKWFFVIKPLAAFSLGSKESLRGLTCHKEDDNEMAGPGSQSLETDSHMNMTFQSKPPPLNWQSRTNAKQRNHDR